MKKTTRYGFEYCDGDDTWYKGDYTIRQMHSRKWVLHHKEWGNLSEDYKSLKAAAEAASSD